MEKTIPVVCPSCGKLLSVKRLECVDCGTSVEGDFGLPILARLSLEDVAFVRNFIMSSGSLKELARHYGVSYPTVRNRLDALIERLNFLERQAAQDADKEVSA